MSRLCTLVAGLSSASLDLGCLLGPQTQHLKAELSSYCQDLCVNLCEWHRLPSSLKTCELPLTTSPPYHSASHLTKSVHVHLGNRHLPIFSTLRCYCLIHTSSHLTNDYSCFLPALPSTNLFSHHWKFFSSLVASGEVTCDDLFLCVSWARMKAPGECSL